jgi:hypothetical protein
VQAPAEHHATPSSKYRLPDGSFLCSPATGATKQPDNVGITAGGVGKHLDMEYPPASGASNCAGMYVSEPASEGSKQQDSVQHCYVSCRWGQQTARYLHFLSPSQLQQWRLVKRVILVFSLCAAGSGEGEAWASDTRP